MHVLYFHQYFQTPKGIASTRSYDMAKALVKAGHNVKIICGSCVGGNTGIDKPFINGYRQDFVENIHVLETDLKYSNHLGYFQRIKVFIKFIIFSMRVLFREPSDIIFVTTPPLTVNLIGIFSSWFKNKPFILEVRDLWPAAPIAMGIIKNPIIILILRFFEWISYRSANKIIALSPGILKSIIARGIISDKVSMIPNTSNLNLFNHNIYFTRPENIDKNDLVAIFAGAHGKANGLEIVLDVAHEIKKRGRKDIKFILIGEGKLKSKIIEKAKFSKLESIIFLDAIPKIQLVSLISSCDIGLQILSNIPIFYYSTSPNKFFDYLAAGLPVLNNYPGWVADLIKKNQCGYVVRPDNPKCFADALIHAADNRENLKQMGINSRNLAKKQFDISVLEKKFVNIIEKVVKDLSIN